MSVPTEEEVALARTTVVKSEPKHAVKHTGLMEDEIQDLDLASE